MKRTKCLVIVTALLLILVSGCSAEPTIIPNGKYKINIPAVAAGVPAVAFELDSALSGLPANAQVYKMVKPGITIGYVTNLGAKFGLTGKVSEGTENFLIGDEATRTYLEVYKATGTFRYTSYSKLYPSKTPTLPSDEEAMKIATDFLVARGLLPEGDVASSVVVGGRTNGIPAHLLVNFNHVIQLSGPGARHGVRIGDGGEVVEVFINPTNPLNLPVHEIVALKTMEQAFQEMKGNKNYYVPDGAKTVHIDSVTVACWLDSIDIEQDYVIPVFVFRGRCLDSAGKQMEASFTDVVEAVQ